jgi:hypothetical protein
LFPQDFREQMRRWFLSLPMGVMFSLSTFPAVNAGAIPACGHALTSQQ